MGQDTSYMMPTHTPKMRRWLQVTDNPGSSAAKSHGLDRGAPASALAPALSASAAPARRLAPARSAPPMVHLWALIGAPLGWRPEGRSLSNQSRPQPGRPKSLCDLSLTMGAYCASSGW